MIHSGPWWTSLKEKLDDSDSHTQGCEIDRSKRYILLDAYKNRNDFSSIQMQIIF